MSGVQDFQPDICLFTVAENRSSKNFLDLKRPYKYGIIGISGIIYEDR